MNNEYAKFGTQYYFRNFILYTLYFILYISKGRDQQAGLVFEIRD